MILAALLALGCSVSDGVVRNEFRNDFKCEPTEIRSLGEERYEVRGCGHEALYECRTLAQHAKYSPGVDTLCRREESEKRSLKAAAASGPRQGSKSTSRQRGEVSRFYDDAHGRYGVEARLPLTSKDEPQAWLVLRTSPKAATSAVLIALESTSSGGSPCEELQLLVNGRTHAVELAGEAGLAPRGEVAWEVFAPLEQRFPSLSVQRCAQEFSLSDQELKNLQRFFVIRTELVKALAPNSGASDAGAPIPPSE
jgi:hypothetical protein